MKIFKKMFPQNTEMNDTKTKTVSSTNKISKSNLINVNVTNKAAKKLEVKESKHKERNNKNKYINNDHGFSLIEMVVAMSILMVFIPVVVSLMNTAITQREAARVSTSNVMNANRIKIELNRDIEEATAIKVVQDEDASTEDGTHLKLRTLDGICKDWKLEDNSLMLAKNAEGPISETSAWETVYDKVGQIPASEETSETEFIPAFALTSSGAVEYNFVLGKEENEEDEVNTNAMSGSIKPTIVATSPGNCWE